MQFRLITYNIHKGIGGLDRRYRPERIIETLAHYEPDIVLLQEVDEGVPRTNHHRQVDLLGEALGLRHRAFQQNVKVKHGHYGNAILSRFPLSDVHDIDLSVRWKKRRRALVAHCHLHPDEHSRTLLIYNMHLGLAGFERSIQLRKILGHESLARTHHRTAVIAGGDFNDVWGGLGKRLLEPVGFQSAAGKIKTFPAFRPLRALDRIYFRGDLNWLGSHASKVPVARQASDHLPIIAEFEIL
jgi:endonuclease/exonuclease/phosphatase family metal-dependent hydrolase